MENSREQKREKEREEHKGEKLKFFLGILLFSFLGWNHAGLSGVLNSDSFGTNHGLESNKPLGKDRIRKGANLILQAIQMVATLMIANNSVINRSWRRLPHFICVETKHVVALAEPFVICMTKTLTIKRLGVSKTNLYQDESFSKLFERLVDNQKSPPKNFKATQRVKLSHLEKVKQDSQLK